MPDEKREICNLTTATSTQPVEPVIPTTKFSNLKRVTAWILRYVKNLCFTVSGRCLSPHLTVPELKSAEDYCSWLAIVQRESFLSGNNNN